MAFQIATMDNAGVEYATAYAKIVRLDIDYLGARIRCDVSVWADVDARNALVRPLYTHNYVWEDVPERIDSEVVQVGIPGATPDPVTDSWPTTTETRTTVTPAKTGFTDFMAAVQDGDMLATAYTKLKLLPEFAGALDV